MVIFQSTKGKKKNERLRDFEGNNKSKKELMKISEKDIKEGNRNENTNKEESSSKILYNNDKNNKFPINIKVHYHINEDSNEIRLFGNFFF